MQFMKMTPEQREAVENYQKVFGSKGQTINVNNYGEPKAVQMPDGSQGLVRFGKDPSAPPVIVPFSPPASDTEQMTAGYASRMLNAENIITDVGEAGNPGWASQITGAVAGDAMKSVVMSEAQQKHRQAQEDWVRAKLRKESGAVIADEEMEREIRTYFPMPWDKPDTIKQKAQARAVAIRAMEKTAGPAIPKAANPAPTPKPAQRSGFDMLPNAKQYDGKTISDTKTGKRYKSQGGKWVEVK
jgi:hypothetical protein